VAGRRKRPRNRPDTMKDTASCAHVTYQPAEPPWVNSNRMKSAARETAPPFSDLHRKANRVTPVLMGQMHRLLLTALPKLAISRTSGWLARLPLPSALRPWLYGRFARRYGCDIEEAELKPADYRCLADFFQRGLRPDARPIDPQATLVWPCDGKIVTSGAIHDGRIPQIKGTDFSIRDLLIDNALGEALRSGTHATIYLAPGDYHRVHSPFSGEVLTHTHLPGGLFPVNPGAVNNIENLFIRNERHVLQYRLEDGRAAAVVLVAALNVGDTLIHSPCPRQVSIGEEIGRFGLGSTVIVLVAPGTPQWESLSPETIVRVGQQASP